MTLYNFQQNSDLSNWRIVDDVVMGGRSHGTFKINAQGNGVFSGKVSLENNGGFSSAQYDFEKTAISKFSKFIIRIKGDGKAYQFRVKNSRSQKHAYIFKFDTNTNWQTIEIPFDDMFPTFRGKTLDLPNFDGKYIENIAFLIANKTAENFELNIDFIALK